MESHPSHHRRHRRRERIPLLWSIVWILWVGGSQRGGALASSSTGKAIVVAAAASLIPSQTINGSDTHDDITGNRSSSPKEDARFNSKPATVPTTPNKEEEEIGTRSPATSTTTRTTTTNTGKGTRMTGAGSHSRTNRSIFSKHSKRQQDTSLSRHSSSNCNPKQRISTQATMKALSGNMQHNSNHKNKNNAHSTAATAAASTTKRLYAKRSADGRQLLLRFHSHDAPNDSSGGLAKDGIVTLSLSAASSATKQGESRLDVQMISTEHYNDVNAKEGGKSKKWTKQWVPLEGIYGVYDLPSGPHLVLITDSDVIYQAPPVASGSGSGSGIAPLLELRKIRSMEVVSFPVDDGTDTSFPRSVAQTKQEQRQLTLLRKSFREHDLYYVPHNEEEHVVRDVTHTLQRSFVHWSQRQQQQQRQHQHHKHNNGPTPQRSPKWWWSLLTISSPNIEKAQILLPPRPDSRFFWNEEQIKPFLQPITQQHQQSFVNDTWSTNPCALLMDHVIPVTSAFVGVERHISLSQSLAVTYDELLMSRRSKYRAGTRFTSRGADATGAVANYAETEQICLIMTNITTDTGKQENDCARLQEVYSHVQTRGSIPLRWSSPSDVKTYRPRILIGVDPLAQARALRTHVLEQLAIYGSGTMESSTSGSTVAAKLSLRQRNSRNVDESSEDAKLTMVNLIDKKGDQGRLGRAFDAVLQAVLDVYGEPPTRTMLRSGNKSEQRQSNDKTSETENPSSSESLKVDTVIPRGIVRHVWFDFHAECKNGQWGKLSNLLADVTTNLDRQGYFAAVPLSESWSIVKIQDGSVRTNCMDCLDRSNVVQSIFGRYMLYQQLHQRLGLARLQQHENKSSSASSSSSSSTRRTLPVEYVVGFRKSSYMSLPWSNGEASHRLLWADNADAISRLYAGTPALKGDFTRTGKRTKRGALDDGMNSLQRYYLNNFMDADRQEGMDLLTGHADFSFVMDDSSTDSTPLSSQTNSDTSIDSTGFSIQEAARQLLLGATVYDESNAPHVRIKQKTNHGSKVKKNVLSKKATEYSSQKQEKVVTRTITRPALDLRWLPGDLKTHVRSAASRSLWSSNYENELDSNTVLIDEEDASMTSAMESLDRRSSSDQPWWVIENDSDDDGLFSRMNHTATSSATGTVRVSHVLGTMIATTRAPLITATAMLCILLPGIFSSARFDTILHNSNTTNPKNTD